MRSAIPAKVLIPLFSVFLSGAAFGTTIDTSSPAADSSSDALDSVDTPYSDYAFFDFGSGGSIFDSGIFDLGSGAGSFLSTGNTVFNANGYQQVLIYETGGSSSAPAASSSQVEVVPEPGTGLLLLTGLAGAFVTLGYRGRRAASPR